MTRAVRDCFRKLTEIFESADVDTNNSLTRDDAWHAWLNSHEVNRK